MTQCMYVCARRRGAQASCDVSRPAASQFKVPHCHIGRADCATMPNDTMHVFALRGRGRLQKMRRRWPAAGRMNRGAPANYQPQPPQPRTNSKYSIATSGGQTAQPSGRHDLGLDLFCARMRRDAASSDNFECTMYNAEAPESSVVHAEHANCATMQNYTM